MNTSPHIASTEPILRTVTWGEALVVAAYRSPDGLKGAVERILSEVGPVSTRNTFAKLYLVENPKVLSPAELWRAWLLLTALGESPPEWGIPDHILPPSIDAERLRKMLPRLDSNQRPSDSASPQVRDAVIIPFPASRVAQNHRLAGARTGEPPPRTTEPGHIAVITALSGSSIPSDFPNNYGGVVRHEECAAMAGGDPGLADLAEIR